MTTTHELLAEFVVLALARHLGPGVVAPDELSLRRDVRTGAFDQVLLLRGASPAYSVRALSFGRDTVCVSAESAAPTLPEGALRAASASFRVRDDPVTADSLAASRAVIRAATIGPNLLDADASIVCAFLRPDRLAVIEAKVESDLARALRGPLDGRLSPCLFGLPDELVDLTLQYAGPAAALALDATCREAARHANNSRLWRTWMQPRRPRNTLAVADERGAREAEAIAAAVRGKLPSEVDAATSASHKARLREQALGVAALLSRPAACEERLTAKLRTEAKRDIEMRRRRFH